MINNNRTINRKYIAITLLLIFIILVVVDCLLYDSLSDYILEWILIDSTIKNNLKLDVFLAQVFISIVVEILDGLFK
ncbi:hypothetical protein [Paraclostridium bifermentans]|uniref:hypothetical protein n=1 Tax=Paraclostridium bifermentans TaxID=1490 RepID=UPI0018A926FA|nr:hypothetical protein [Paraclostridium bifermentans]